MEKQSGHFGKIEGIFQKKKSPEIEKVYSGTYKPEIGQNIEKNREVVQALHQLLLQEANMNFLAINGKGSERELAAAYRDAIRNATRLLANATLHTSLGFDNGKFDHNKGEYIQNKTLYDPNQDNLFFGVAEVGDEVLVVGSSILEGSGLGMYKQIVVSVSAWEKTVNNARRELNKYGSSMTENYFTETPKIS